MADNNFEVYRGCTVANDNEELFTVVDVNEDHICIKPYKSDCQPQWVNKRNYKLCLWLVM